MAETFQLRVVTPERTVMQRDVVSVVAPGSDGYFGVLAHHAPMLAEIGVGRLTTTEDGGQQTVLAVSGGFAEVRDNGMTVLADAAEFREEIDRARAERGAERARERLDTRSASVDVDRAQAALYRALNRLSVAAEK
jgi:F-type H+-transporting ATPase subunit epsilon